MKLRKVEILGFKSFREKVSIEIDDGMTGIVGPNGCGKSNVVDAIKWAMGDMSPKSLRGQSMQDVIFAGSQNHKPLGMAEVTLTFANDSFEPMELSTSLAQGDAEEEGDQWRDSIPREFQDLAEIAMTRRLFRSGESEYQINKVTCRLMDIQNLLAGTGLGKQGYSIIEQGQIGFIVNARPSQRRLIIEEASGITRYKSQRERSERRLEKTEQNLQRTRDVLDEVGKQLRSLERQARRAEEQRRLVDELRQLEVAAILQRRVSLSQAAAVAKKKLQEVNRGSEHARRGLEASEQALRRGRVEAHETERAQAEATEAFYKLETRLNLTRSNHEHARQSAVEARERWETAKAERVAQEKRRVSLQHELAQIGADLEEFADPATGGEERVAQAQASLQSLREDFGQLGALRDRRRSELMDQGTRRQRIDDRLGWIAGQIAELTERRDSARTEFAAVQEEVEDLERCVNRLLIDLDGASAQQHAAQTREESAQAVLQTARQVLKDADASVREATALRVTLQARMESIEAMRQSGEGYTEGVQAVLKWAKETGRDDVLGPAGDLLKVEAGWESPVAAFLGDRVGDIVVKTRQTALDALDMLAEKELGRVACYILQNPESPTDEIKAWIEGLELVDSLRDVGDLSQENPETRAWATPGGDILFAEDRVVGGWAGDGAEAIFKQARALDLLRTQFQDALLAEADANEALELAQEDVVLTQDRLERAREAIQQAKLAVRGLEQEIEADERQLERSRAQLRKLKEEQGGLAEVLEGLRGEVVHLEASRGELVERIPELEVELEGLQDRLGELQVTLELRQSELTSERVRLAEVGERKRGLEQSQERITSSLRHAEHQIQRFEREAIQLDARAEHFEKTSTEANAEAVRLAVDHEKAGLAVEGTRSAHDKHAQRVQELELELIKARREAEGAQQGVQKLELEHKEAVLGIEHVDEQLMERFGLTLEQAQPVVSGLKLGEEARRGRINYLKSRIESMGPVNSMAIEEFEETRERKTFLEEQQDDMERAVEDLRTAIAKMDRESRKRFKETFEAVNAKFQEIFPRLFRGGQAQLILTEPDDLLNSGVDIEVQPPGKKLQNVTLLSGGEKALTAVSLIFSIFLLKPTPFAILDEVDAPLDEANVGRFADMVKDLSATSQMIVITHNRRTMEAPEMLYGVTMQEPGVSKVVAVRLSEIDDRIAS